MPGYDVFISYRREGGDTLSRLLYSELTRDGYSVFYDVETMRSGKFNEQILESIAESKTVVVVLPPHGLDRCADPADWVRQELEFAVSRGKILIPVLMRGFEWPSEEHLPPALKELPHYQGIAASDNSTFNSWYTKLKGYIDEQIGGIPASQSKPSQSDRDYQWGLIALEDGDFEKAESIFDEMLKKNPQNALGWLGKTLAKRKLSHEADLSGADEPLEEDKAFLRALRCADPEMRARLEGYAAAVKSRFVSFGRYPRTAEGLDYSLIEWLVLERDGSKALLISKYGLDAKAYHDYEQGTDWAYCTLRRWLNIDFFDAAFSPEEQQAILEAKIDNGPEQGYPGWHNDGGTWTEDRVFLLSYAEAWKYFPTDESRKCAPTDFAVSQGAYRDNDEITPSGPAGRWWLRSPGAYPFFAASVSARGTLHTRSRVERPTGSVRPVIWVDTTKLPSP